MEIEKSALILCGGLGTRLSTISADRPKCMMPVGDTPLLHHLVTKLCDEGFTEIHLALGYKAEIVLESDLMFRIQKQYKDVKINYSVEKEHLLGTGGAVWNANPAIAGNKLLVLNGDTYLGCNLGSFWDSAKADSITIGCKYLDNCSRYGVVHFDTDLKIVSFEEKKQGSSGYVNLGLYVIPREFMCSKMPDKFSLEYDYFPTILDKLRACVLDGMFIDIGVPEDYYLADKLFHEENRISRP